MGKSIESNVGTEEEDRFMLKNVELIDKNTILSNINCYSRYMTVLRLLILNLKSLTDSFLVCTDSKTKPANNQI